MTCASGPARKTFRMVSRKKPPRPKPNKTSDEERTGRQVFRLPPFFCAFRQEQEKADDRTPLRQAGHQGREKVREGSILPVSGNASPPMRRAGPFFTGPSCSPGPGCRFRGQAAEKNPEHPFIGTWKTAGWRASLSLTGKKRLLRPFFLLLADGKKQRSFSSGRGTEHPAGAGTLL